MIIADQVKTILERYGRLFYGRAPTTLGGFNIRAALGIEDKTTWQHTTPRPDLNLDMTYDYDLRYVRNDGVNQITSVTMTMLSKYDSGSRWEPTKLHLTYSEGEMRQVALLWSNGTLWNRPEHTDTLIALSRNKPLGDFLSRETHDLCYSNDGNSLSLEFINGAPQLHLIERKHNALVYEATYRYGLYGEPGVYGFRRFIEHGHAPMQPEDEKSSQDLTSEAAIAIIRSMLGLIPTISKQDILALDN